MGEEEGLEELAVLQVCWSVVLVGVFSLLMRFVRKMWLKPARIRSVIAKQGIGGPRPSSFLVGNVPEMQKIQSNMITQLQNMKQTSDDGQGVVKHNWDSSMFPYLQQWAREYGPVFLYSTGAKQHLYVSDPKLLRELKLHNSLDLCRPTYLSKPLKPLLGNGLIVANGHEWAYQRKLIAPEFFLDKVKGMVGLMEESTMALLETWENRILETESSSAEMRIDLDLKTLSADIISRACFGSSYSQGNQIFAKIAFLQDALSKPNLLFGFLNFSFFRTETDMKIRSVNKEVDAMLLKLVNDRRAQSKSGGVYKNKDLLEMILERTARDSTEMAHYKHITDRFILDNCRNIYFAGSETTALTVSWTLMLLSLHPEWQERIRAEIVEICGDNDLYRCFQDMDTLSKFKTLTMVIQESLRLYGPGVIAAREALTNMKLGDLEVPAGIHMWVYHPALHRDTENWGEDAKEFKPERFANGVSKSCKYPQAYMPFGFGTRLCIGQTFAMLQVKIVLSLILSKFSFSLSPKYRHSPVYKMLLLPEHGIQLIVRSAQS